MFGSHPPLGSCVRREMGALGVATGLPAAPCLVPRHACPLALPREEVVGVGGDTLAGSWEPPWALPARGISGAGGWGLHIACLPHLLPEAPKQRLLRQPLLAENWEVVVLSHPGLCHFSETSATPTPPPQFWLCTGQAPVHTGVRCTPHPLCRGTNWRVHVCVGCVQAPGDLGPRESARAPLP